MEREIVKCTHCKSESTAKSGKDRKGLQRYSCKQCRTTFTEPHAFAGKKTSVDDGVRVLGMLLEGMSIRSCVRLTGISKRSILAIMVQAGENCRRFTEATIRNVPAGTIECDEQWSFVGCKQKTATRLLKGRGFGDRYVYTAIDRDSKLLLCWHAGIRDSENTWGFLGRLKDAIVGRPTIHTDGYAPYETAVPKVFHQKVDFGQIIKQYHNTPGHDSQSRYSPGGIIGVRKTVMCGNVDPDQIGTSRMERFNLTTRMSVRRFTRLTNAHSKKTRNHDAMLGLYFAFYNFCRKHQTIKATPAQKAGLATECWSLERLLTAAAIAG
jgi:transposase-like protein/IS1 family transposase